MPSKNQAVLLSRNQGSHACVETDKSPCLTSRDGQISNFLLRDEVALNNEFYKSSLMDLAGNAFETRSVFGCFDHYARYHC